MLSWLLIMGSLILNLEYGEIILMGIAIIIIVVAIICIIRLENKGGLFQKLKYPFIELDI